MTQKPSPKHQDMTMLRQGGANKMFKNPQLGLRHQKETLDHEMNI